jgi:hypothetical protein
VIGAIVEDLGRVGKSEQGTEALALVHRFTSMAQATPALRAALAEVLDRLTQLAAASVAASDGSSAEAPENQMAATAIIGLWRVELWAMQRYADGTRLA